MVDPDSPDTVVPSLRCDSTRSGHPSRPGPVFGFRGGVIQMPTVGKYHSVSFIPNLDTRLASSEICATSVLNDDQPCCSYRYQPSPRWPTDDADPERTNLRIMDDPDSPDTVVPSLRCDSTRSGHPNRPGPVIGFRGGVIQMPTVGKYHSVSFIPDFDTCLASSEICATSVFNDDQP